MLITTKHSITHIFIFTFFLLANLLFAQNQQKLTLAISDFSPNSIDSSIAEMISEKFRTELIQTNVFRIMERNQMDMILEEQGFQQTGACNTSECLVEVGQLLGVDHLIVGTIGKIENLWIINARILNVQTGEVAFSISDEYEGMASDFMSTFIPQLVRALIGEYDGTLVQRNVTRRAGILFLETNISGAQVIIDNKSYNGVTPITIENISEGSHRIEVQKDGYYGTKNIFILSDELLKVKIEMGGELGSALIITEPINATVYRGEKQLGNTPFKINNDPIGKKLLLLKKTGYLTHHINYTIEKNKLTKLKVTLKKAAYLNIDVEPYSATLEIVENNKFYVNKSSIPVIPGKVHFKLQHEDYQPIVDSLEIISGNTKNLKYSMVHTEKYYDNIRRYIRYVSGVLFIASSVYALHSQNQLNENLEDMSSNLDLYTQETDIDKINQNKNAYNSAQNLAQKNETLRNISLASMSMCALGFSFTYIF